MARSHGQCDVICDLASGIRREQKKKKQRKKNRCKRSDAEDQDCGQHGTLCSGVGPNNLVPQIKEDEGPLVLCWVGHTCHLSGVAGGLQCSSSLQRRANMDELILGVEQINDGNLILG